MKIGLIGYGQMGKEVESIALSKGHSISFIIDENNQADLTPAVLSNAGVVIEFTRPGVAFSNIKACLDVGVPVVSGTTGWLNRFEEIKALCTQVNGGFFYASNFSIGVNLFFELNVQLAHLMSSYPDYSVRVEEIHHTRKMLLANDGFRVYFSSNGPNVLSTSFQDCWYFQHIFFRYKR